MREQDVKVRKSGESGLGRSRDITLRYLKVVVGWLEMVGQGIVNR